MSPSQTNLSCSTVRRHLWAHAAVTAGAALQAAGKSYDVITSVILWLLAVLCTGGCACVPGACSSCPVPGCDSQKCYAPQSAPSGSRLSFLRMHVCNGRGMCAADATTGPVAAPAGAHSHAQQPAHPLPARTSQRRCLLIALTHLSRKSLAVVHMQTATGQAAKGRSL